jgi:hypothetical protein
MQSWRLARSLPKTFPIIQPWAESLRRSSKPYHETMSHPASITVKACSAESATASLAPATIPRREPTDLEVKLEILYCGTLPL